MKTKCLGALCAAAVAAASAGASAADAATTLGPVSFRVEGPSATLVPLTSVSTIAGSFSPDGNPADSCPFASAGGVLQLGTNGNWTGTYDASFHDYFVNSIEGVSPGVNQYWTVWYDHAPAQTGACGQAVNAGDDVLFFIDCYGAGCPNAGNGYAVLGESTPATAAAGSPLTVAVTSYDAATGAPSPAVGATVSAGSLSAVTDASGHASLTFPSAGSYEVQATATDSIRSETRPVCVHNGNDGTCGTTAPGVTPAVNAPAVGPSTPTTIQAPTPATSTTAIALSPHLTGVINHHRYRRGHGPRTLSGTVPGAGPIGEVDLKLTRVKGNRCFYFSGRLARFAAARCTSAVFSKVPRSAFFMVSRTTSFDYLLPRRLGHGHYVAQAQTVEVNGRKDVSAPVSFNVR